VEGAKCLFNLLLCGKEAKVMGHYAVLGNCSWYSLQFSRKIPQKPDIIEERLLK